MRLRDHPLMYHEGTIPGRIPAEAYARCQDLIATFGGSFPYWLNRLFMYGFDNEPALKEQLERNQP